MACTGCHVPDWGGPIEINLEDKTIPTSKKSGIAYKWFNRTTNLYGEPIGSKNDGMLYPYRVAIIREPVDSMGNPIPVDPESDTPMSNNISGWREREIYLPLSHGVQLKTAYVCSDCHGNKSKFDWSRMGIEIKPVE